MVVFLSPATFVLHITIHVEIGTGNTYLRLKWHAVVCLVLFQLNFLFTFLPFEVS